MTADLSAIAQRMNDTIYLRGPNSHGVWSDQAHGLALGHRRLSILDLSPEGHQPHAVGVIGRFVMVNGEVYSFRGLACGTGSPRPRVCVVAATPEMMLAAFCQWGVAGSHQALQRHVRLMPLWDREARAPAPWAAIVSVEAALLRLDGRMARCCLARS